MAVSFNEVQFLRDYPEFVATASAYPGCPTTCFNRACTILNNSDSSPVPESPRSDMLNMLTAHFISMFFGVNGQKPHGMVGRISSAGEGSVNAQADMGPVTNSQAWYMQTQYGATYWMMVKAYRSALYIAPPAYSSPVVFREG